MATSVEQLIAALEEAADDLRDAYSAKTKVSATRARKALMTVKKAAHEARGEVLAISKGEQDPVNVDLRLACCVEDHHEEEVAETEEI